MRRQSQAKPTLQGRLLIEAVPLKVEANALQRIQHLCSSALLRATHCWFSTIFNRAARERMAIFARIICIPTGNQGTSSYRKHSCIWEDATVPKFHFEIIDGFRWEDPVGLDCKSEQQARKVAEDIARQIVIDIGDKAVRKVLVIDERGSEIYTAPIKN
jgi:hypothetical protein